MSSEVIAQDPFEPVFDQQGVWDRLDNESVEDFRLFVLYREMGHTRSLARLSVRIFMPRGDLLRLSKQHSWTRRAEEYDTEHTRLAILEIEREVPDMRKRMAEGAKMMMQKALDAAENFPTNAINARDLPVWIDISSKLERASRGVSDAPKKVEITGKDGGSIQVEAMPSSQRDELLAGIAAELMRRGLMPAIEPAIYEGEIVEDEDAGQQPSLD